jgi:hypothetical protein
MKIANPYGRAIEEWVGKTPDEVPPEHVQLRIWDRQNGRCYVTGRKIAPGDKKELEHILALADGGENRERNLAWIIIGAHKEKTSEENSRRAEERKVRKNHVGIKTVPTQHIASAPFPISDRKKKHDQAAAAKLPLPPRRSLFRDIPTRGNTNG